MPANASVCAHVIGLTCVHTEKDGPINRVDTISSKSIAHRFLNSCLEAERTIDNSYVIVDGFNNAAN